MATDPAFSPDGRVFVVDRLKHSIFVYSPNGQYLTTIGRGGKGDQYGSLALNTSMEYSQKVYILKLVDAE